MKNTMKKNELDDKMVITRKELAAFLGISRKTLYRWFEKNKINIEPGLIKNNDLEKIRKKFGI